MDALQLLTWSLILYLFASLASLFLLGLDRLAIKLSGICNQVNHLIPTRVLVKGGEITCKILK
ncbi:hypothetical protein WKP90_001111 [Escherichia coli]